MLPRCLCAQTLPVGNTVYIVGGLTDALDLAAPSPRGGAGAAAQRPRALVLNHTTAYNTYTQIYTRVADMPQPRCEREPGHSSHSTQGTC